MTGNRSHPVLTDGTHCLVAGVTGSGERWGGKTSTAAWWMDSVVPDDLAAPAHFRYGIAFSPKGNRFPNAKTVSDMDSAFEALGERRTKIEWTVDGSPIDGIDLSSSHAECMEFARRLPGDVFLVHDDAVLYSSADSLQWATATAGNPPPGDPRIKSVVVSQDPWDLPRRGVRSNLPVLIWVGPTTAEAEKFFRQSGKSEAFDVVESRHKEPYRWSIIDGAGDVATFNPVPSDYA